MGTVNYHAFWYRAFSNTTSSAINLISDPTTGDNPVGVDWYKVTDHGDQFGPFGALSPLQKDRQVGRGIFRCAGDYFPVIDGLNATEQKLENRQLPGN
mmetsp:Transcript_42542/g.77712  ORF Transcript_42542/g.77712 Transcript_42542/m.77712 type:complete len:98 (-) Transcript_42542:202-495(-)